MDIVMGYSLSFELIRILKKLFIISIFQDYTSPLKFTNYPSKIAYPHPPCTMWREYLIVNHLSPLSFIHILYMVPMLILCTLANVVMVFFLLTCPEDLIWNFIREISTSLSSYRLANYAVWSQFLLQFYISFFWGFVS
jgi:hypothetical protein